MVTVFHYTPVNAKQFDGLNIDGVTGKRQKRQNSPHQNFVLYGIHWPNINEFHEKILKNW